MQKTAYEYRMSDCSSDVCSSDLPDVRPLAEARERRYQQAFLTECRPVALRIFKQAVRYRNPDRAAAALEPVVENDARDLRSEERRGGKEWVGACRFGG